MKLHLTKSLRAALLACVCGCIAVIGQAAADGTAMTDNGHGNFELKSGTIYDLSTYNGTGKIYLWSSTNVGLDTGSADYTVALLQGGDGASYVKYGTGELTISSYESSQDPGSFSVAAGKLTLAASSSIAGSVSAGAALNVTGDTSTFTSTLTNAGTVNLESSSLVVSSAWNLTQVENYTGSGNSTGTTTYYLVQGAGEGLTVSADTATVSGTSIHLTNDSNGLYYSKDTYFVKTATIASSSIDADVISVSGSSFAITGWEYKGDMTLNGATVSTQQSLGSSDGSAIRLTGGDNTIISTQSTSLWSSIGGTGNLILTKDATSNAFWLRNTITNIGTLTLNGAIELKDSTSLNNTGVLTINNYGTSALAGSRIGSNVTGLVLNNSSASFSGKDWGKSLTLNNASITLAGGSMNSGSGTTITLASTDADKDGTISASEYSSNTITMSNASLSHTIEGTGNLTIQRPDSNTDVFNMNASIAHTGDLILKNLDAVGGSATLNNTGALTLSNITNSTDISKVGENVTSITVDNSTLIANTTYSKAITVTNGGKVTTDNGNFSNLTLNGGTVEIVDYKSVDGTINVSGTDNTIAVASGGTLVGVNASITGTTANSKLTLSGSELSKTSTWGQGMEVRSLVDIKGEVTVEKRVVFTSTASIGSDVSALNVGDGALLESKMTDASVALNLDGGTVSIESGKVTLKSGSTLTSGELKSSTGTTLALSSGVTLDMGDENVTTSNLAGEIEAANGSKLDLTGVTTLGAEALDLAAGSTLIFGNVVEAGPIVYTGSLNIAEGIIIDLSAWCANTETEGKTTFDPYMALFTTGVATLNDLDESTSGAFSHLEGVKVTLIVDGYINENAWLSVSADGNTVSVVPEPTTATLSLLALAGLAMRRRRK